MVNRAGAPQMTVVQKKGSAEKQSLSGTVNRFVRILSRGCHRTKSKQHLHRNAIMLCLDSQVVCLPGIEAAFELHNGKARLGEAFCGFGGKMAHLGVAIHDVYSVFIQT